MIKKSSWLTCLLAVLLNLAALADSGTTSVTVLGVRFPTVAEYSEDGSLLREIKSDQIPIGAPVTARNESLGIVKVKLKDREAWLGAPDLKLSEGVIPPCPKDAASAAGDKTAVYVSGVGEAKCMRATDGQAPHQK